MKYIFKVEVETVDPLTIEEYNRLMLAAKLRDVTEGTLEDYFEDEKGFQVDAYSVETPAKDLYEKHPMRLDWAISEATGNVIAIVQTPCHQGTRGSRTFISWPCAADLIKDYGSIEAYFNHIDSGLVNEKGEVDEAEFIKYQAMGPEYTGWFEIPDVLE